jgi:dTDP-4-amino-4,6-dideoxygalactose transaminase
MAEQDDKAGLPLSQTKITNTEQSTLIERLSKLEDRLHNLLACYQFYDHAIRAMTNPEQLDDSQEWYFGLFLNQQWLRQQGERVMAELVDIKLSIKT